METEQKVELARGWKDLIEKLYSNPYNWNELWENVEAEVAREWLTCEHDAQRDMYGRRLDCLRYLREYIEQLMGE